MSLTRMCPICKQEDLMWVMDCGWWCRNCGAQYNDDGTPKKGATPENAGRHTLAEIRIHDPEAINQRVIVISNDEDIYTNRQSLWTGYIIGFQELPGGFVPIIRHDKDEKDYMVMGAVYPYDEGLYAFLSRLSTKVRWELITNIHRLRSELERLRLGKEKVLKIDG